MVRSGQPEEKVTDNDVTKEKMEGSGVNSHQEEQHPFDLSFTHQINYENRQKGYNSENETKQERKPTDDDLVSSIIESDSSFTSKLRELQNRKEGTADSNEKQQRAAATKKAGQVRGNLKRMLTVDFKSKDPMNESQTSTFVGMNASMRQQMDVLSNLQPTADKPRGRSKDMMYRTMHSDDKMKNGSMVDQNRTAMNTTFQSNAPGNGGAMSVMSKTRTVHKRMEKRQLYQVIDTSFFSKDRPSNPLEFIDKRTQKVTINPGIPYVSSSQTDIFEIRNALNMKNNPNENNKFIAAPEEEHSGAYEGYQEEVYIRSAFEPYQLKTIYKVKKVDEIEWDDEDEDLLILAQQPFETVMQIGFKDHLNHLNTKFIARRSDIIVSSTLSITMSPLEDGFTPVEFANVTRRQIDEYVERRQEFRALSVQSNSLASHKKREPAAHPLLKVNSTFTGSMSSISQGEDYTSQQEDYFDSN